MELSDIPDTLTVTKEYMYLHIDGNKYRKQVDEIRVLEKNGPDDIEVAHFSPDGEEISRENISVEHVENGVEDGWLSL